jgi:hypothetical protein
MLDAATPTQVTVDPTGRIGKLLDQTEHFARTFNDALSEHGAGREAHTATRAAPLRQQMTELVGLALFLPLLKQARQSAFRSDLFHGGAGEDMFAAQLDQVIADRLSRRTNLPLVQAAYRRYAQPIDHHDAPKPPTGLATHG